MSCFHLCGVPQDKCSGGNRPTASANRTKVHSTSEEAFKCYEHYLLAEGWHKVGSREFEPPNRDGPIRVLTKKSRFGMKVKGGKRGDGGAGGTTAKRCNTISAGGGVISC